MRLFPPEAETNGEAGRPLHWNSLSKNLPKVWPCGGTSGIMEKKQWRGWKVEKRRQQRSCDNGVESLGSPVSPQPAKTTESKDSMGLGTEFAPACLID